MQENQDFFAPAFVLPKRKRGRPKGSTKSISSVSPGTVGRPRKDKDTAKIKTTLLFHLTKATESQVVVHRGGSRSSKSYSIAQLIVEYFFTLPKIKILILRKTGPSLRTSVVPLIYQIIDSYGLRHKITEVKMDRNIWSPVKGLIHFSGLDDPEKLKSSDWNICWLEEANEFLYADFNNLKVRLSSPIPVSAPWFRNKLILSLNPVNQFCWVKTKAIDNKSEDLTEIVSSYKFNPFLSDDYRNLIEALRFQDENHYRIFAQGEWGVLENIIYSKWETVPELSEGEEVFGLDFGVTNETALVRCFIDGLEMGIESWIYETGMTNSDLIARMERMFTQEQKERCPIYCDTAEKNRLIELENAGFYVVPANKSVLEGLDYVSRLNIKIKDDSEPIIKEIRAYSRKEDKRTGRVGEFPIKWADHCMDAMRYAAFTHYTETTQNTPSLRVLDFFDSHARDTWENDEDY